MHHESEIGLPRRYVKVGRYAEPVPSLKPAAVYAACIITVMRHRREDAL